MSDAGRWWDEPPRLLAALAAVLAAGLVALGALSAFALLGSDFPLSLAERLQRSTTTLRTSVPLLLVAGLALGGPDPVPGPLRRWLAPGALAVAVVAGALLVGRTVADLVAARPGAAGTRIDEVLVDLGALVLVVAAGWWAARSWDGLSAPG